MTSAPILGEAVPVLAANVEAALRSRGRDVLADQIHGLRVAAFCDCAPKCSAFLSVPLDERPPGRVLTSAAINTAEMIVLVDTIGDWVVGLDILDRGQVRAAVENFAKPSK